jgi:hypothetical protein
MSVSAMHAPALHSHAPAAFALLSPSAPSSACAFRASRRSAFCGLVCGEGTRSAVASAPLAAAPPRLRAAMADSRKSTAWVDWVVKEVREHQLRSVGARGAGGSAAAAERVFT